MRGWPGWVGNSGASDDHYLLLLTHVLWWVMSAKPPRSLRLLLCKRLVGLSQLMSLTFFFSVDLQVEPSETLATAAQRQSSAEEGGLPSPCTTGLTLMMSVCIVIAF